MKPAYLLAGVCTLALLPSALPVMAQAEQSQTAPEVSTVEDTMKTATRFMVEDVATNGGYVWAYLPDFSRRWGEMEAYPSMVWTQAPGTPEMGEIFLDAYHATGDEYYYDAAMKAAQALIDGQHPSGGWNYVIDTAGEESIKRWYDTIGRNGWRLEEFQHYYGNATFDDHATVESGTFLMRLYLEKRDPEVKKAVDKAISFVLDSQYANGGWPQRWPDAPDFEKHGQPDYTGFITLNDEVAQKNIDFLLLAMQQLDRPELEEPIRRAMDLFIELQQPQPTPGWALQYTMELEPASARTYEPAAISPHTTDASIKSLFHFYELTGDDKYLAPIPAALEWLEKVEAPAEAHTDSGRNYYRYVEAGTNRFMAVRRRGSNAQNGEYYVNYDMTGEMAEKRVDTDALWQRYETLQATPAEQLIAQSPLYGNGPSLMPYYVVTDDIVGSDLNTQSDDGRDVTEARIHDLVQSLGEDGYWPTELRTTSHPYKGPGPDSPPEGFVDRGQVGDEWDTSPFTMESGPMGISTGTYIRNMSFLIEYVDERGDDQ
ncbi:pectate lyase [Parvularcula flava]|uniref:Pectate lyase n=3 Tax=Aquisalinus luteolus TaxID=1566827 RepID=A0A8J3A4S2_9PROT|nr:pectate lyase [Aquisalinus luteolus]GGH92325.1 pectate lyase [Aquisalinus luteolus]